MMRKLIIAVVLLAAARVSNGCSCGWMRPFVEAARGMTVAHGIVRSYVRAPQMQHPIAMDVQILGVLQGNYKAKTMRIVGDFGMSCVPYVENFPIDTEWVFAVGGPAEIARFGDENFTFGPCAESGARVKDGRVITSVDGTRRELTINDLRNLIVISSR